MHLLQAAEKLVLAEGSKMVMVGLQSAYNQAIAACSIQSIHSARPWMQAK